MWTPGLQSRQAAVLVGNAHRSPHFERRAENSQAGSIDGARYFLLRRALRRQSTGCAWPSQAWKGFSFWGSYLL
jgi:hypothetical protein